MKYIVTINDKNYEVLVDKCEATVLNVTSANAPVSIKPQTETVPAAPVAVSTQSAVSPVKAEGNIMECPMPGTILDIKKAAGERVKKGETVMILEAMKMENEIPAANDGIVGQIFVAKGSTVSTGEPLFSLI